MKWDSDSGFIEYKIAVDQVKSKLGLPTMYHEVRRELAPYLTYILKYLNVRLMSLGDDAELIELVQEVLDIFSEGSDKIVGLSATELAMDIGIDVSEPDFEADILEYYENDRFIFTWTNVLSCLVTQLKMMYPNLFDESEPQGCSCPCPPGETWKDWESYSSGVYPEDEEYNGLSWGTSTKWKVNNTTPECTCRYQ